MGSVRIRIRITSRYQADKELGEMYRADQTTGETFTQFKKRMKRQNNKYNTSQTQSIESKSTEMECACGEPGKEKASQTPKTLKPTEPQQYHDIY